jgi:hypothetical protein
MMRTKSPTPLQKAHTPGFQDESAPRSARLECVANYRKYLRNPKLLSHYTHTHTLALFLPFQYPLPPIKKDSRLRINLIQKPPTIRLPKNPRKPPRRLLQRLHILNLHNQHVPRLRGLDVERAGQVVDFREVDIPHVVGRVVVADLSAGPVDAFDFDDFVGGDGGVGGVGGVPAVLSSGEMC